MKRWTKFFTIKEQAYEELRASLAVLEHVNPSAYAKILQIIKEHEEMVEIRKRCIKEQAEEMSRLFAPLFPEPVSSVLENCATQSEDVPEASCDYENTSDNSAENKENSDFNLEEESGTPTRKKRLSPKPSRIVRHSFSEKPNCPLCQKSMTTDSVRTRTLTLCAPVFRTEVHHIEACRCLDCGGSQKAPYPALLDHTVGTFHFSALASLASLRYLWGVPSFRLEAMSTDQGHRISDSTQWTILEQGAGLLRPFFLFLRKFAAEQKTIHMDDTSIQMLEVAKEIAAAEQAKAAGLDILIRSGIHTTNMTAVLPEGQKIVIFDSGLHHAGEAIAKLIESRSSSEQLILMADALNANLSKLDEEDFISSKCNAHAFRRFKEQEEEQRRQIDVLIEAYKKVFKNEHQCKHWEPDKRLKFHQENSLPLMKKIRSHIESDFRLKRVEPNSVLGKSVYQYFLNHYDELIQFCCVAGAPLENNLSERMLKVIVRHRKNSLFFKTRVGAKVGDIYTSLLSTARENGINSSRYLEALLTYPHIWKADFESFLPWNFEKTMDEHKLSTLL